MNTATWTILEGDCRDRLAELPAQHFHCVVTSPPYFGLRDYQVDGQIGLEPTPDAFIAAMRAVFGGKDNAGPGTVWHVLRDDGLCWINLGDSYAATSKNRTADQATNRSTLGGSKQTQGGILSQPNKIGHGYKPKDMMFMPHRVAMALQADGWYVRDAIVWHKPAPMPGSQRDRCTSSHEFIFQLAKRERYFFDMEAIKERCVAGDRGSTFTEGKTGAVHANVGKGPRFGGTKAPGYGPRQYSGNEYEPQSTRIPRNVWRLPWTLDDAHALLALLNARPSGQAGGNTWQLTSEPCKDAHFATYPTALPRRCIQASTSAHGCCPKCGAPWVRVIAKLPTGQTQKMADGWDTGEGGHGTIHRAGREKGESGQPVMKAHTLGWMPSCRCAGVEPTRSLTRDIATPDSIDDYRERIAHAAALTRSPCRVLDPFGGAGTTAIAANQLGHDCTLIELNSEYAAIARTRISRKLNPSTARSNQVGDAPLFAGMD